MASALYINQENHLPTDVTKASLLSDNVYSNLEITGDVDGNMFSEIVSFLESDDYGTTSDMMDEEVIHVIADMVPESMKNNVDSQNKANVSPSPSCNELVTATTDYISQNEDTNNDKIVQQSPLCTINAGSSSGDSPKTSNTSVPLSNASAASLATSPSATKKRRRSSVGGPSDDSNEEAKKQRNRYHAKRSREKKKSLTLSLQKALDDLKAENALLRARIYAAIGKKKTDGLVKAKCSSAQEAFIAALKKPENRVVDSEGLKFLQGLRAKMPSNQNNGPIKVVA